MNVLQKEQKEHNLFAIHQNVLYYITMGNILGNGS